MQIKSKYSWLKHIDFIAVDLIALFLSYLISYYLKFHDLNFYQNTDWVRYLFLVLVLNVLFNFILNPYSGILKRPYYMEIITSFRLALYNLLAASGIFYAFKIGATYSREMSFVMYGIYFLLSTLLKFLWKKLLVSGKVVVQTTKQIPLFIIGSMETISNTVRNVTAGDFRLYDIQGIHLVDGQTLSRIEVEGSGLIPVVGKDYLRFILDNNIGEVLVAVTPGLVEPGVLERLNANAVGLNMVVEAAIGFQPEDQYILNVGIYKTLSVGAFSFTPGQMLYLALKRLMDTFFGLVGLALLVPLSLLIKLAYLLCGDTSSIFYRQNRVGQDGRKIRIWKFRSMVPNAEEELQRLLKEDKYRREWEENQKFSEDPRITKVGRFLRKTSIDEFPQMINVFRGEMSLVGPRPLIDGELEAHGGLKLYQKVKPGITGWWACNGRSNIDYRERLELEYYYVKNCSLWLDLLVIFRTVLAVLTKTGAK
ncbi:MAG: exopolysaccharide biosynthesis polyprenyl glycosylphosphotransferase [Anaerolineaceae bacterium]|nr:exopolysaccharide biosynthesis polyprenyl glycosylphosphotransferase [Anaerolineaceae bacterium]